MSRADCYDPTNRNSTSFSAAESFNEHKVLPNSIQQDEDQKPTRDYLQSMSLANQFIIANDGPYDGFDPGVDGEDRFDLDVTGWIGDFPSEEHQLDACDLHDKRKPAEDQDEDDEGGGKRRESEVGSAKKPGRKPVAAEPTTKRKAQNRAAQRAFRDRKEKHLKDLETKVEDLEKVSESANNENSVLRRHVEKLQAEIKHYRKRVALVSSGGGGGSPPRGSGAPATAASNFRFDFPLFGQQTADSMSNGSRPGSTSVTKPGPSTTLSAPASNFAIPGIVSRDPGSNPGRNTMSPNYTSTGHSPSNSSKLLPARSSGRAATGHNSDDRFDNFGGLFTSSLLPGADDSPSYFQLPSNTSGTSHQVPPKPSTQTMPGPNIRQSSNSSSTNTNSPDSSHDAQHNNSSLCTSPEGSLSSPGQKLTDHGLITICEETQVPSNTGGFASMSTLSSTTDPNSFNWLVQQNGGAFDPVLFEEYREPEQTADLQDFGNYFNDALPSLEPGSPEHHFPEAAPSNAKTDIIAKVEAAQDGQQEAFPSEQMLESIICPVFRERLRSTGVRNGEIDSLCNAMKLKARCSESGAGMPGKT